MEDIFTHLVKSTALALVFMCSYYFFLRKETFFTSKRIYLLAGVLIAMFLPFLRTTKIVWIEATPLTPQNFTAFPTSTTMIEESFDWSELLFPLYMLGVLFFTMRFVLQLYSIAQIKKGSNILKEDDITHVRSEKELAPFSFFKNIFYCPYQFKKEELNHIITHEKVHVHQYHTLDVLFMEAVCIAFWFNPASWFYKVLVKQNLEFLADSKTLKTIGDKKRYQYLMLQQATGYKQFAITNPFFNPFIKKRIVMLNQKQSHKVKMLKLLIILPLLGVFLVGFNTTTIYKTKKNRSFNEISAVPDTVTSVQINNVTLEVDKDSKDENLKKDTEFLAGYGVQINFKNIKRNKAGEITAIKVDYDSGSGNKGNYQQKNDSPITPFKINIDFDENDVAQIGISSVNTVSNTHKSNTIWVSQDSAEQQIIEIRNENGNDHFYIDGQEINQEELAQKGKMGKALVKINSISNHPNTQIDKLQYGQENGYEETISLITNDTINKIKKYKMVIVNDSIKLNNFKSIAIDRDSLDIEKDVNTFIIKSDSNQDHDVEMIEVQSDGFFFMDLEDGKNPLFFINGKKSTLGDVKKLDKSTIKSMEVKKGDGALKKYGKEAKDGAIEITTKIKTKNYKDDGGFEAMLIITPTSTKENTLNQLRPFNGSPFNLELEDFKVNPKGLVTDIKISYYNRKNEHKVYKQQKTQGIDTVFLDAKFNDLKSKNPLEKISEIRIYSH